jgi:hypothetical protein
MKNGAVWLHRMTNAVPLGGGDGHYGYALLIEKGNDYSLWHQLLVKMEVETQV